MSAIVCKVFPRPISSARMQPLAPDPVIPITQRYMNWSQLTTGIVRTLTPSFWCSRILLASIGSRTTSLIIVPLRLVAAHGLPTHFCSASLIGGRSMTTAPGAFGSCNAPPHASMSFPDVALPTWSFFFGEVFLTGGA